MRIVPPALSVNICPVSSVARAASPELTSDPASLWRQFRNVSVAPALTAQGAIDCGQRISRLLQLSSTLPCGGTISVAAKRSGLQSQRTSSRSYLAAVQGRVGRMKLAAPAEASHCGCASTAASCPCLLIAHQCGVTRACAEVSFVHSTSSQGSLCRSAPTLTAGMGLSTTG
jgi:hypothetical protein